MLQIRYGIETPECHTNRVPCGDNALDFLLREMAFNLEKDEEEHANPEACLPRAEGKPSNAGVPQTRGIGFPGC
jgi:hypothetical protein